MQKLKIHRIFTRACCCCCCLGCLDAFAAVKRFLLLSAIEYVSNSMTMTVVVVVVVVVVLVLFLVHRNHIHEQSLLAQGGNVEFRSFQIVLSDNSHTLFVSLHHDLKRFAIALAAHFGQTTGDKFALVEGIVEQADQKRGQPRVLLLFVVAGLFSLLFLDRFGWWFNDGGREQASCGQ